MGHEQLTVKSRVVAILQDGPVTSLQVAEILNMSVNDASAHLCHLRHQGVAQVIETRPSQAGGRELNVWALTESHRKSPKGPSIAAMVRAALEKGPATSCELGEAVGLSGTETSGYLYRLRRRGDVCVIATKENPKGRDKNIWALTPTGGNDLSGQNPIKIRPEYTDRPCLGPLCRGKKMMRSSGPGHRMCPNCRATTRNHDAEEVAREVQGWNP